MDFEELVRATRSCRRFHADCNVDMATMRSLIDLARLSASAANLQPLKYIISNTKKTNDLIFPLLKWAAYLKGWDGPVENERPSAYIIMLGDTSIAKNFDIDLGIAIQNIALGVTSKQLAACGIATIRKDELRNQLHIDRKYEILYVMAIGRAREEVVIEPLGNDGDVKYWRSDDGVHHVPKRNLNDIIIGIC